LRRGSRGEISKKVKKSACEENCSPPHTVGGWKKVPGNKESLQPHGQYNPGLKSGKGKKSLVFEGVGTGVGSAKWTVEKNVRGGGRQKS